MEREREGEGEKGEERRRDSTPQDKCTRDPSFGTAIKKKKKKGGESQRGRETHDVLFPSASVKKAVSAVVGFSCNLISAVFHSEADRTNVPPALYP